MKFVLIVHIKLMAVSMLKKHGKQERFLVIFVKL